MSESFGSLDHIMFAMAPLGIVTAIVGAIRVSGSPWLKAVIGRARENVTAAEVEFMSSTSHEVCELWNGDSVVRILGRPKVQQLVFLKDYQQDSKTVGLYTLDSTADKERTGKSANPMKCDCQYLSYSFIVS